MVKKLWSIYTAEYYSAMKKEQPVMHATWMNLRRMMLSEKKSVLEVP